MNKKLITGLILLGIVAILLVFFTTAINLPRRIYTSAQQEFLEYNRLLSVEQSAPTMNRVDYGGSSSAPEVLTLMPNGESRVQVLLAARYEEKQGVAVTVYDLQFQGEYLLTESIAPTSTVDLFFPFPNNLETLHNVRFVVDDTEPPDAVYTTQGIRWRATLKNGETRRIAISYRANGANSFAYGLPRDQRTNLDVVVTVTGLQGSSAPSTSLPSTGQSPAGDGETFAWKYSGLIANRDIRLDLPSRLSFTQRVAQFQDEFLTLAGLSPFLIGLFLFCLAGLFSLNGTQFRLEGYLLAGLGLALFYPFLAFTSGMIGIIPAAIVAFLVVSVLLFVFFGLSLGWAKTWRPLGLLIIVFLGFFTIGVLTPWSGLSLTSGGLLLVGVFMWAYARRSRWPIPAADEETESVVEAPDDTGDAQPLAAESVAEAAADTPQAHCFHCGRALEEGFDFCPGCGQDARVIQRCQQCDHLQHVPPTAEPVYCVYCGHAFSGGE